MPIICKRQLRWFSFGMQKRGATLTNRSCQPVAASICPVARHYLVRLRVVVPSLFFTPLHALTIAFVAGVVVWLAPPDVAPKREDGA